MSVWVPEDQRDTSWPIWNKIFKCRVPFMLSRSPEDIKFYGVRQSGEPTRDAQSKNELIIRYLTISQMVDLWRKGVPVYVMQRDDTKIIYDLISAHLEVWKNYVLTSLTPKAAPIEDLIDLDRFASTVYEHAKFHFDDTFQKSAIEKGVAGQFTFTRGNLFKRKVETVETENGLERVYPQRKSMADIFIDTPINFTPGGNFERDFGGA